MFLHKREAQGTDRQAVEAGIPTSNDQTASHLTEIQPRRLCRVAHVNRWSPRSNDSSLLNPPRRCCYCCAVHEVGAPLLPTLIATQVSDSQNKRPRLASAAIKSDLFLAACVPVNSCTAADLRHSQQEVFLLILDGNLSSPATNECACKSCGGSSTRKQRAWQLLQTELRHLRLVSLTAELAVQSLTCSSQVFMQLALKPRCESHAPCSPTGPPVHTM